MSGEAQLQIHEFIELSFRSLTCTVRCLAGLIRLGESVQLVSPTVDRPIVEGLTLSDIQLHASVPFELIDMGRTALITVTGAIDVTAVRATTARAAPGELRRLDLRFVAR